MKAEEPPVPAIISKQDWVDVSRIMADHLVDYDPGQEVLEEMEKHGASLMLSPDQKRMRPGIGRKLFQALDIDLPREQQLQLLSTVEGVHFWTKGVDDIQDGDDMRNGLPTLHNYASSYLEQEDLDQGHGLLEWLTSLVPFTFRESNGERPEELGAHLANNYFLDAKSRIPGMLSGLDSEYFDAETREQLRDALDNAQQELASGQNLDLAGTRIGEGDRKPNYLGGDIDVMEYMHQTNRGKTAELFALLGRFASIVSEDYDGDELEQWGREAGQAFQITDDVLDLENGRFSDIAGNNYTVPIYVAERYLHSHPDKKMNELGQELSDILRSDEPGEDELERANYIITEETPAVEASYNLAEHLSEHATGYEGEEDIGGVPLEEVDWDDSSYMQIVRQLTRELGYQREK